MRHFRLDPRSPDPEAIGMAADAIRAGDLVVFPTETVYGLAADALSEAAVRRVFDLKDRDRAQPLPVQIAGFEQLSQVAADVPDAAIVLAQRFWPGPLTLVLRKSDCVPDIVTGGGDTIGVRVPDHPVALALLRELASPIIATSANVSGRPAPTSASCAVRGFGNMISVVLDTGDSGTGVASTIVDVTAAPPRVLRVGTITIDQIREAIGEVDEYDN